MKKLQFLSELVPLGHQLAISFSNFQRLVRYICCFQYVLTDLYTHYMHIIYILIKTIHERFVLFILICSKRSSHLKKNPYVLRLNTRSKKIRPNTKWLTMSLFIPEVYRHHSDCLSTHLYVCLSVQIRVRSVTFLFFNIGIPHLALG